MLVISGRVIPMFTANGTATKKVDNLPLLEAICIISSVLISLFYVSGIVYLIPESLSEYSSKLIGMLFFIAGSANAIRALRWQIWVTLKTPLVWSLHIAYWFIPFGFCGFALHYWGFNISKSAALHCLTVGAMGSLALAMISRVSLGHTGRMLKAKPIMTLAFGLISLAGIARIISSTSFLTNTIFGFSLTQVFLIFSGILWMSAYAIFVFQYSPALMSFRVDGKSG